MTTERVSPSVGAFEFDGASMPGQGFAEATFGQIVAATSSNPYVVTIVPHGASQFIFENTTDAEITVAFQGPLRDAMRIKDPADVSLHVVTTLNPSSGFANDNPAHKQFIVPAGTRVLVWPTTPPTQGKFRVKIFE